MRRSARSRLSLRGCKLTADPLQEMVSPHYDALPTPPPWRRPFMAVRQPAAGRFASNPAASMHQMWTTVSLQRAPACLRDAVERSVHEVARILLVVKIELAFEAKLKEGGCHRYMIGGRRVLDVFRDLALDGVGMGPRALLENRQTSIHERLGQTNRAIKAWGMRIAKRAGMNKARVA